MRKFSSLALMFARRCALVLVLLTACVWAARMYRQFTCVGSSLGSLAADAYVGGGRVLRFGVMP